jgi:hypothetical protein
MTTFRDHVTGRHRDGQPLFAVPSVKTSTASAGRRTACRGPVRALPGAGEIPASALGGGRSAGHRRQRDLAVVNCRGRGSHAAGNAHVATCPMSLVRNNSACQLFRKASCANLARKGRAVVCGPRGVGGMAEDSHVPPLPRRARGDAPRRGPGPPAGPLVLPEPVVQQILACWRPSGQRHHLTAAPPGPRGQPRITHVLLRGQHRCPSGCRARAPCGSRPRRTRIRCCRPACRACGRRKCQRRRSRPSPHPGRAGSQTSARQSRTSRRSPGLSPPRQPAAR